MTGEEEGSIISTEGSITILLRGELMLDPGTGLGEVGGDNTTAIK